MVKIYYYDKEFARNACMGVKYLRENGLLPDSNAIEDTHTLLIDDFKSEKLADCNFEFVGLSTLEKIFNMFQGENWSPNGEAREFILSKGLSHTSMSVGDVIQVDDEFYMADIFGFSDITNYEFGSTVELEMYIENQGMEDLYL